MDNFKVIYRILSELEKGMDEKECDINRIDAEQLGISKERWLRYLEMLSDSGYIKGVKIYKNILGDLNYSVQNIQITMDGLEYLHENSTMQKIFNTVKGIKDILPGM